MPSIGASIGYGRGYFDSGPEFFQWYSYNSLNNFEISGLISYKPVKAAFLFNSGFAYHIFSANSDKFHFLSFPVNTDFQLGNKYLFQFGLGLYIQTLLYKSTALFSEHSTLQAGFNTNVGVGYVVNDKYSLLVKIRKDNDFTRLFRDEIPNRTGKIEHENIYTFKYCTNICLYYRLKE